MMKLSYRDKIIAIVVTVLVILAVGAIFIVKPEIDKYNAKQIDVANKETEKTTVQAEIDTLPVIQRNIITALSDISDLQTPFFLEEKHYQLEQLFHSFADEAGMEISDISFEITAEEIVASQYMPSYNILAYQMKMNADLYGTLPEEVMNIWNNVEPAAKPVVTVGIVNITATFQDVSSWNDIRPFIDLLTEMERTIIINTLSPGEEDADPLAEESSSLPVSVTLYTIVPMDTEMVIEEERKIAESNGTIEQFNLLLEEIAAAETAENGETDENTEANENGDSPEA
jgi:hypothetical protein